MRIICLYILYYIILYYIILYYIILYIIYYIYMFVSPFPLKEKHETPMT